MLSSVHIKNVALIDNLIIDFTNGLNVISGETGAGKSIILDAIDFVLGGKSDKSLIRNGTDTMKVSVIFSNLKTKLKNELKSIYQIDCTDDLLIERTLSLNGRSTCFINGELVTANILKKIALTLVDIHGQIDHISILKNDVQLEIVDRFDDSIKKDLETLNLYIDKIISIENEINSLGGNEQTKLQLMDLYSYQINEINQLNLKQGEFESLKDKLKELSNIEKIANNLSEAINSLDGNSSYNNVISNLNTSIKFLKNNTSYNSKYDELTTRLNASIIEIEDILDTLKKYLSECNFDEFEFNRIDSRLDAINKAFKKYGYGYDSVQNYLLDITKKYDNLINSEQRYNELSSEKENILKNITNLQNLISTKRKKVCSHLEMNIENCIKSLGMKNAKFKINIQQIDEPYSRNGKDSVEFMFSSNLGFDIQPLKKVASGGEMSRVMLGIKIIISHIDDIDTLIFDEIDTGLSGNTAQVVAENLYKLSKEKQIISISHLPQIASFADQNYKVEKFTNNGTTISRIKQLNENETYIELSRLMGADSSEKSISLAKEIRKKNLKQNVDSY